MACAVVPGIDNLASSLIAYTDCQAGSVATRGYGALTTIGGLVPSMLVTLLTIFIALWGYRLLAGARADGAELIGAFARVAIVLTLASSWPAYQRLVYDVVLDTPSQIAGTIDVTGTGQDEVRGLAARLDDADARFVRLAVFGAGAAQTPEESAFARANTPPPLFLNFDSFAFGVSRLTFLVSAVGSFVLVRLLSGALVALGPLIVMFLLFNVTRGLVIGWSRALVGLIIAGVVSVLVVDIETMLLTPWLSDLLAKRAADQPIYGASSQLLATTIIFAIVVFTGIKLSQRLTTSVWPAASNSSLRSNRDEFTTSQSRLRANARLASLPAIDQLQRRAQTVADSIVLSDHRRTRLAAVSGSVGPSPAMRTAGVQPGRATATGRSTNQSSRRAARRGSASATQRDRR